MKISILVPVYNEEGNLDRVYHEVLKSFDGKDFELIFIDDGSTDGSVGDIRGIIAKDGRVRLVKLKKNYGQHMALAAGFDNCRGDYAFTLDADLQNDPEDILLLLKELEAGRDFVSGWRKDRKDPFFSRKLPSKIINIITSMMTGVELHDYHCALKGFSREIVDGMQEYTEMRRCLPALAAKLCKSPAEVPVRHHEREGASKYSLWGLVRVYTDFYISFSTKPFQVLTVAGLLTMGFAGLVSAGYVAARITGLVDPVPPLMYLVLLAGVTSIQLVILGVLGEYLIRIHKLLQDRSLYKIESIE